MPGIYEDSNIHLSLPSGWSVIGGTPGDILLFSDGSEDRQLSVSFYTLAQRNPESEDVLSAARDVFKVRVEQARKNLSPDDPFEESGVSDAGAAPIGTFSGTQTETGRMFAGRLKSKNRQTVILYLESYVGTPQETAALADEILSRLQIK
jgi:hypothetical protein